MASAIRASMTNLILRCRRYIGDTSGATQHFADDALQDAFDERRITVRYAALRPGPTLKPGALYDYLDYYSDVGQWEEDVLLSWNDFSTLTPVTADYISGHWTFDNSASAAGQYPIVFITGKFYDVHATAADLLEQWAASLALAYDFTSDGQSFHRSQMAATLMKAADQHRMKAMPTSAMVVRSDVMGDHPPLGLMLGGTGSVTGE